MAKPRTTLEPVITASLGEMLRYFRERANLLQRELAQKVGYHYSYISRLEKNKLVLAEVFPSVINLAMSKASLLPWARLPFPCIILVILRSQHNWKAPAKKSAANSGRSAIRAENENFLNQLKNKLGADAFKEAWSSGQALSTEQAAELAIKSLKKKCRENFTHGIFV
ncbi:MAG: helix-turn-helix transcriptional regulator [Anaerolineales bacterium]|uniref:helix-turn-helix domain-containing protein n=1 Tax=Candidatus Villigracilis proximus TaxID=3140683 RepID=UPI003136769A|nr:helix-turn-helix transcriptional regulator [Anaerolineales bacterium]